MTRHHLPVPVVSVALVKHSCRHSLFINLCSFDVTLSVCPLVKLGHLFVLVYFFSTLHEAPGLVGAVLFSVYSYYYVCTYQKQERTNAAFENGIRMRVQARE